MQIKTELLHLASKGDRKAQYALYQICFPVLIGVCMRYKRDKDEAVASMNQGFLKIIQNLDKFQGDGIFEAWIRRIMTNSLIDEFRREKKHQQQTVLTGSFETDFPDESPIDWNEADQRMDAERVEALLKKLPPTTFEVFNLFALDNYSHKEIGEMLSISEGTSKWHVSFARQKLREWLRQEMHLSV